MTKNLLPVFIGVDGGGTKTTAVLTNADGSIFRTCRTGACNVAVLKPEAVAAIIESILAILLKEIPRESIGNAVFAFAGAGRTKERENVRQIISNAGVRQFSILTDAEILYHATLGNTSGILLSAGTGSICLVRGSDGAFKQIGGRGYLLGDEGSGFDIGNQAIRKSIRDAEDGNAISELTRKLLEFYNLQQPEELVSIIYTAANPPNVVASCAKLVCDLAESGEADAKTIVDGAAKSLLALFKHATEHLPKMSEYPMALAGSVLSDGSIVSQRFKKLLRKAALPVQIIEESMPPAAAAARSAILDAGMHPPPGLITKLSQATFE